MSTTSCDEQYPLYVLELELSIVLYIWLTNNKQWVDSVIVHDAALYSDRRSFNAVTENRLLGIQRLCPPEDEQCIFYTAFA